jgi:hypothetical protein
MQFRKFLRGRISRRVVGPLAVEIDTPVLDSFASTGQTRKEIFVPAFVPKAVIETFDGGILDRFAEFDDPLNPSPRIKGVLPCQYHRFFYLAINSTYL